MSVRKEFREQSYHYFRKEGCLPPRDIICRLRGFRGKRNLRKVNSKALKICAKGKTARSGTAVPAGCSQTSRQRFLPLQKDLREQSYHYSRKQGCPAQRAPNCRYFGLWRKGELARAKIVSLENRAKRENEPQSAAGLSRRCLLSNHGILSRLCVRKFVKKEEFLWPIFQSISAG